MTTEEESRILSKEEVNCLLGSDCSEHGMDKIKILIVEDDHHTQQLYDKGLFNQIFDKKMVASGKEALFVYDEWHPDIILLDIYLPEMTGYQVLKAIRTTIEDSKTTIVMATALSGTDDVMSCLKLGVEGYIIKPFPFREIAVKILGYYAKKEPERAQKVIALCREIAKKSQVRWLLDKEKPKTKENKEEVSEGNPESETEEAGGGENGSEIHGQTDAAVQ
ncbi:MAG: response regulator [Syntrophales bacterium]